MKINHFKVIKTKWTFEKEEEEEEEEEEEVIIYLFCPCENSP